MKKTISLLLAVVMLISVFSIAPTVSADTRNMDADYIKGSNQELLDMLNKLDPQQFADYSDLGLTEEQFNEIREETIRTLEQTNPVSDYEKLKVISNWVSTNIEYDYALVSGSQDAYNVFTKRLGICQGYSNVTTAMCAAAGIPCIMVNGDSSAGGHAWNMAYADNRWIFLDNTWGNDWFDCDIDTFSQHHKPYYTYDIKVTEGDFVYTYFNGVAPCEYVGQDTTWTIPSSAFAMAVTSVSINLFNSYDCKVETLVIPETVKNMECSSLLYCSYLKNIIVDENNGYFASYEGVLFDKSLSELIVYPAAKEESSFAIPNTVTALGESVFAKNKNLTDILIPASVTSIGKEPFADSSKITIYADEGTYGYEFAQQNGINCKAASQFESVDKSVLEAFVKEIENTENVYTVNSFNRFSAALGKAVDTLKDDSADQELIDSVLEELKAAYEGLKYIKGDLNHNGKVEINDATAIQIYLARIEQESFDENLADVNADGTVSIYDATLCQMVAAKSLAVDDDGNIVL